MALFDCYLFLVLKTNVLRVKTKIFKENKKFQIYLLKNECGNFKLLIWHFNKMNLRDYNPFFIYIF